MAYWYQKDKPGEPENLTMWTREGAAYLINLQNPKMQELYFSEKRRLGCRYNEPLGDMERWVWEVSIIAQLRNLRNIPEHIVRRILLPPYRRICEAAGVDIIALEKRIKKGPPKRSAVS